MKKNYSCSCCRKEGVKLWRPFAENGKLLCAECAEKRQFAVRLSKNPSLNNSFLYIGNDVILPMWKVDDEGMICACGEPKPFEASLQEIRTNILFILYKENDSYTTCMLPAVPKNPDQMLDYHKFGRIPNEAYKWWKNLPTR